MCAFTVLNFATYVLWWNKPLNVNRPVLVYQDEKNLGDRATDEGQERGNVEINARTESEDIESRDETPLGGKECGCGEVFIQGLVDIPKEVYRVIIGSVEDSRSRWGFLLYFVDPILGGISFESNQRVGTFGPEGSDDIKVLLTSAAAAVGIVFGSIHGTAWQFPSYIEQIMWRISAISVTGGPIVMVLSFTMARNFSGWNLAVCKMGTLLVLILYIVARLSLLVLSFTTLRSLPPGAFRTTDWTHFIPHFA